MRSRLRRPVPRSGELVPLTWLGVAAADGHGEDPSVHIPDHAAPLGIGPGNFRVDVAILGPLCRF
jgi:hypothetical protein